jgi:hypothetical protein
VDLRTLNRNPYQDGKPGSVNPQVGRDAKYTGADLWEDDIAPIRAAQRCESAGQRRETEGAEKRLKNALFDTGFLPRVPRSEKLHEMTPAAA